MISVASIKARLKNHAKESGHTLQNELTMYGLCRGCYPPKQMESVYKEKESNGHC